MDPGKKNDGANFVEGQGEVNQTSWAQNQLQKLLAVLTAKTAT